MSDDGTRSSEWANRLLLIDGVITPTEESDDPNLPVSTALDEVQAPNTRGRLPRKRRAATKRGRRPKKRRARQIQWTQNAFDEDEEEPGSIASKAKNKVRKRLQDFATELMRKEAVSIGSMMYREAQQGIQEVQGEDPNAEGYLVRIFEITELLKTSITFFRIGKRDRDVIGTQSLLVIWYEGVILPNTKTREARTPLITKIIDLASSVLDSLGDGDFQIKQSMEEVIDRVDREY
jgi:hypothetical protein